MQQLLKALAKRQLGLSMDLGQGAQHIALYLYSQIGVLSDYAIPTHGHAK